MKIVHRRRTRAATRSESRWRRQSVALPMQHRRAPARRIDGYPTRRNWSGAGYSAARRSNRSRHSAPSSIRPSSRHSRARSNTAAALRRPQPRVLPWFSAQFQQRVGPRQVHPVYGNPRHDGVGAQHAVQQRAGVDERHRGRSAGILLRPADPARIECGRSGLRVMPPRLSSGRRAVRPVAGRQGSSDPPRQCVIVGPLPFPECSGNKPTRRHSSCHLRASKESKASHRIPLDRPASNGQNEQHSRQHLQIHGSADRVRQSCAIDSAASLSSFSAIATERMLAFATKGFLIGGMIGGKIPIPLYFTQRARVTRHIGRRAPFPKRSRA